MLQAQYGLANLTYKDKRGIQERAWLLTKEYETLLSQISSTAMYPEEVKIIIHNSYAGGVSRIFENEKVIIEEDLIPNQIHLDQPKDTTVDTYLKRFDLMYKDTNEQSVFFKNIEVSNVKSKDYIYVQVIFDAEFKSINKIKPKIPFQNYKRVVEMRAVKQNGKWNGYITYVGFYNPNTFITSKDNMFNMEEEKKSKKQSFPQKRMNSLSSLKIDYERLAPHLLLNTKKTQDDEVSTLISTYQVDLRLRLQQILSTADSNGALVEVRSNLNELLEEYKGNENKFDATKQEIIRAKLIYLFLWESYILYLKERYQKAIVAVNKGLVYDIDDPDLQYQKAILFSKLKEYGKAKNALKHVFKANHYYPQAHILLSKIHFAKDEKEKALKVLSKYIVKNGEFDKNILFEMAEVYASIGDRSKSEIYYKKSYVVDPEFLSPLFKVSKIGIEDKRYQSVISYLENKNDRNRKLVNEAKYNYYLGTSYYHLKKNEEAISFLKKAVELNIDKVDAYLMLAKSENKIKKSLSWIKKGVKDKVITKRDLPLNLPESITKKAQYQAIEELFN